MSFCIVHLSDPHFGIHADLRQIRAVEDLVPDLGPRLIVLTGDLTHRARHGEFQAARGFVRELERSAPVHVVPGNHDVQWWKRPLVPFDSHAKYERFAQYFGPVLAPTTEFPEALVVSALTAHGLAWGSLTLQPRDLAVKGYLRASEGARIRQTFAEATPGQARVLVLHHNVLRGMLTQRMGFARWQRAQQMLSASGAELILCGHDHHNNTNLLGGRIVVSCTGTVSSLLRGDYAQAFHRIVIDDESVTVEQYSWEAENGRFRRSDVNHFARPGVHETQAIAAAS